MLPNFLSTFMKDRVNFIRLGTLILKGLTWRIGLESERNRLKLMLLFLDVIGAMSLKHLSWNLCSKLDDKNHQVNIIKTSTDFLHIYGGPITKAKVKKMQAALNGLIENYGRKSQFKVQDTLN